jgi:acetylglutamate kinase
MMERLIEKAKVLTEALPYIQQFAGKTFVIKYGGSAMREERLRHCFAEDIVLMKFVGLNPVVVHGGGPQIDELLRRLGKETSFVKGLRVTDAETMEVVEMVLVGKTNKELVRLINQHGGRAVGLSGKDGELFRAKRFVFEEDLQGGKEDSDIGFVGEVESVNPAIIACLERDRFIPVVAPVGVDAEGQTFNINADLVAGKLAVALKAHKLVLLTDVEGILDPVGELLSSLSLSEAEELIKRKVVSGGMIPKVRCCIDAVRGGVSKAHIIDGRLEHAVLLEVFTVRGVGTEIYRDGETRTV